MAGSNPLCVMTITLGKCAAVRFHLILALVAPRSSRSAFYTSIPQVSIGSRWALASCILLVEDSSMRCLAFVVACYYGPALRAELVVRALSLVFPSVALVSFLAARSCGTLRAGTQDSLQHSLLLAPDICVTAGKRTWKVVTLRPLRLIGDSWWLVGTAFLCMWLL